MSSVIFAEFSAAIVVVRSTRSAKLLPAVSLARQKVSEHAERLCHMRKICFDEDNGDADLILQRVEVLGHVALLVAEVNDDLRVGSEQRLEVQICLAPYI